MIIIQVLSETVANALKYYGNPETKETERFIRNFDKFFDLLNVRSLEEHKRKNKPNLKPYERADDERLAVRL